MENDLCVIRNIELEIGRRRMIFKCKHELVNMFVIG
jgi:hypothetical protein